jgi:hypothetical protein
MVCFGINVEKMQTKAILRIESMRPKTQKTAQNFGHASFFAG